MHARKSELDLRWLRSNLYEFLLVTEDSVLIAKTGPFTPPLIFSFFVVTLANAPCEFHFGNAQVLRGNEATKVIKRGKHEIHTRSSRRGKDQRGNPFP